MAGHAQPLALLEHPGIGKAPEMLIRLGAVSAFRMIDTRNNRGCGVEIYLHILDIHEARLELRIREIRQELPSIADPKIQPSLMNIQDVKVDFYATTAIVSGIYHTKGTYGAKPYEHFGRFTDTWVFQEHKWLCVASHTSLLKK